MIQKKSDNLANRLTLGSLFDGSGGFPLGGLLSGITPVWASEIEPFPIRVTTKRLPIMKHYGDVSKMDGGKIEPVDIITFGSPCQDMSVAGKRAGLDGSRSNLFYEAIRIVKEMRRATDGKYPRYIVWENVPGAFSSNKGADFQFVLEAICSVKGREIHIPRPEKWTNAGEIVADDFSLAWRVLDAQYWGVPQRRKRIYLVADFADGSAGKILFESEGVSGYTPQGFRPWQGAAGAFAECAGAAGFDGYNGDLTGGVSSTLGVNSGISTGRNGVIISAKFDHNVVAVQGSMIGRSDKNGPQGSGVNEGVSFTLDAADRHAVAYCMTTGTYTQALEEQSPTLMARDYKDPPVVNETEPEYIVRRLTPTECARLQGFPDWWCAGLGTDEPTEDEIEFWTEVFETHRSVMGTSSKPKSRNQIIKWLKNPHTDSAEYKMWGNGVALPNVYFVLSGIVYYAQTQEIDR